MTISFLKRRMKDARYLKSHGPSLILVSMLLLNTIFFLIWKGDFSAPETVSAGSALEKVFKTEDLNKILLNLGAEPGTATQLQMKVDIIMSKQYNKASDVSSLTATPYSGVLDLTTSWGVVGSATPNGWGDGPDTPFFKTSEPGINVAYINMIEGEWKIREDNDWAVNYGSDNNDGTLQQDGGNIPVTAGTYKITFDENNLNIYYRNVFLGHRW